RGEQPVALFEAEANRERVRLRRLVPRKTREHLPLHLERRRTPRRALLDTRQRQPERPDRVEIDWLLLRHDQPPAWTPRSCDPATPRPCDPAIPRSRDHLY